jgi:2-oxoglutarate ferredoxin oxidoreductase subunit alpha
MDKHVGKLDEDGIAIFNSDVSQFEHGFGLSGKEVLEKFKAKPIMKNTAFLGAFGKVIGVDWDHLEKVFREEFKKETDLNLQIAKFGYDSVEMLEKIEKFTCDDAEMITGNEAIALAACKSGLEFYAAYPMTPATSILHWLANHKDEYKLKVMQAENEISVIMVALGASYAGKRNMVATSGGGFALMVEGISFAHMGELPIVIVNSQRPGPATGIPTYSAQADLHFALSAGHGDTPRIVLMPGDAKECAELTELSLNSSWKYQMPVILLVDKDISEGTYVVSPSVFAKMKKGPALLWDGEGQYGRYKLTKDGISPMAFPGNPNAIVKATSYEHDENGITIEEEVDMINTMQEKKLKKWSVVEKDFAKLSLVKVYGNKNAKTALISWGAPKGAVIEAAESLNCKVVQPLIASPFPKAQIEKALKGVKKVISVEANATGQFGKVMNGYGLKVDEFVLKYDGRPFTVEELQKILAKKIKK